jgi:hypothetical protein
MTKKEELLEEYGYEVNTWYDARENDRPKVSALLCYLPKNFWQPYILAYPNGEALNDVTSGKRHDYSECASWLVPYQNSRID